MQDSNAIRSPLPPISQGRGVWYASIILFLSVVGASVGLYVFLYLQNNSLDAIQGEIIAIEKEIAMTQSDPKLGLAKIIQENGVKNSIDLKGIVTQFRLAAIRSNVSFDGFSVKDGIISTSIISTSGNTIHSDPVATIVSMIREYTKNDGQELQLGKITTIDGTNKRRTTNIEFRILSTSNK